MVVTVLSRTGWLFVGMVVGVLFTPTTTTTLLGINENFHILARIVDAVSGKN